MAKLHDDELAALENATVEAGFGFTSFPYIRTLGGNANEVLAGLANAGHFATGKDDSFKTFKSFKGQLVDFRLRIEAERASENPKDRAKTEDRLVVTRNRPLAAIFQDPVYRAFVEKWQEQPRVSIKVHRTYLVWNEDSGEFYCMDIKQGTPSKQADIGWSASADGLVEFSSFLNDDLKKSMGWIQFLLKSKALGIAPTYSAEAKEQAIKAFRSRDNVDRWTATSDEDN